MRQNFESEGSMYLLRHSKANYKTYAEILKSDNPQAPVEREEQILPDLTPEHKEFANKEAEKFFEHLDPQKDLLFFVSSDEARALETANIYREKAHTLGFEVVKPYKDLESNKLVPATRRKSIVNKIGGGEIRTLPSLSLNIKNTLISSVFNPENRLNEINWEAVDDETKEKWDQARRIINKDDHDSWGANFFYHSEELQKIFPELASAKEKYETKFHQIVKLIEFAYKKIKEHKDANPDFTNNIKVIGFGHENYLVYALNEYFKDHEIGNCEAISFTTDDMGQITLKRREETKQINQ